MTSSCPICLELQGIETNMLCTTLDHQVRNAVFAESSEFALIPSLGPLVVGHSLLVTRQHACCLLSELTPKRALQFRSILEEFSNKIYDRLGKNLELLCFEHGSTSNQFDRVLCSTAHAHVHLVPLATDVIANVLDSFDRSYSISPSEWEALPSVLCQFSEYLTVIQVRKHRGGIHSWVRDGSNVPSQFVRRLISEALSISTWDWKVYNRVDLLRRTISIGFKESAMEYIDLPPRTSPPSK